jgi:hypothetical protein
MSNLKMMINNAADRATLSASPVAPGMSAAAMLTDTKSNVCRATGTEIEIVLTWEQAERIGGVHHPWCNGSPLTTIQVLGYADKAGATQLLDTGERLACPARERVLRAPWTPVSAASAYAYGGGAHAFTWFDNVDVKRLVIRLKDPGNRQGYLEVSRVYVGEAFSPDKNMSYGLGLTPTSTSAPFRTDAGDRRVVRGTKGSKLEIELGHMTERDRSFFWDMLVANGIDVPAIIDLDPGAASAERARDHRMYGVLVQLPAMRRPNFASHMTSLEWESM